MTPAMIMTLAELSLRYGPEFVTALTTLMKKEMITVDDAHNLFANVKPYAAYNIPDVQPTLASSPLDTKP